MAAEPQVCTVRVDSKGRIVLPPSIRYEVGIDIGDVLSLKRTKEGLTLVPARRSDFFSRYKQLVETPPPRRGKPENRPPSKMKSIWKKAEEETRRTKLDRSRMREAIAAADRVREKTSGNWSVTEELRRWRELRRP